MKISVLKSNISLASILVIIIYLAISDFFGVLDVSLIIPGELYDYCVVFLFCIAFLVLVKWKLVVRRLESDFAYWPFVMVILLSLIQAVNLHNSGQQSLAESFSVIREILFLFVAYALCTLKFQPSAIIKLIIRLDMVSVCVYAIEMIHGGPIFSVALHAAGLYETLGGITVWRSWVDLPVFELFTIPYLLISIVKREYVFSARKKDMFALCVIFGGMVLKLGRSALMAVAISAMLAYLYVDRPSAGKFLMRTVKIMVIAVVGIVLLYFFANGIFQRLADGLVAVLNVSNNRYDSTLSVRTRTMEVRWEYLIEHGKLLFGLGPFSYKASLVIDPYDTYATNRGVFSPDSAYATFLVRYGIVGTGLYVYGFLKNYFRLRKHNPKTYLATASFLVGSLIGGFSGYDALGKQTLLKVGLLVALCAKEGKNSERYVE